LIGESNYLKLHNIYLFFKVENKMLVHVYWEICNYRFNLWIKEFLVINLVSNTLYYDTFNIFFVKCLMVAGDIIIFYTNSWLS